MARLTVGTLAAMSTPDTAALADRLAGVGDLRALTGGASSLTYSGVRDGVRVVVKVAPAGVEPVLHRDVLRQARVLRALAGAGLPLPTVLHEDPGAPVDVPPLFVMSFLDGSSLEPLFDRDVDGPSPDVVAERWRDAARVLARLHTIAPAAVGLGDEPVAAATDEVERWARTLRTVDRSLVPAWEDVAARLRDTAPAPATAAIVHGDFRLGNLLAVGGRITAVVDWEIWSVGDPRIDLGWFLLNADPDTYRRTTPYADATPSSDALLAEYAAALGHAVPDVGWFTALAAFKSAATWGLIIKHNRRRADPDPAVEAMGADLPHLLDRARAH